MTEPTGAADSGGLLSVSGGSEEQDGQIAKAAASSLFRSGSGEAG
jgi:hypothetical protein